MTLYIGSKGGAVVRALASHQCVLGSNPGVDLWVEFVVGSLLCSERFFSGYSGFPLSSKTNISNFKFDQESGRRRTTMWMCYLQIVIYLFSLFYIGRPRKAGPPPERKLEGSIDVIGGEGSRGIWIVVL